MNQTLMELLTGLANRFSARVALGILFSVAAFAAMQPLAKLTGLAEVANVLPALAILFWLDLSLMIGRAIFSPAVDHQGLMTMAAAQGSAASMAWLAQVGLWVRLGALLWLIHVGL